MRFTSVGPRAATSDAHSRARVPMSSLAAASLASRASVPSLPSARRAPRPAPPGAGAGGAPLRVRAFGGRKTNDQIS